MSAAGSHQMSDSGSDSDVTVGPDEEACCSPDLFEDEPKTKQPAETASRVMTFHMSSKPKLSPLKRRSTVHELSDSDPEDQVVKKISTSSPRTKTPTSTPLKKRAQSSSKEKESGGKSKETILQKSSTMETIYLESTDEDSNSAAKPTCPYGSNCYRKNPSHFEEYKHPGRREERMSNAKPASSSSKLFTGRREERMSNAKPASSSSKSEAPSPSKKPRPSSQLSSDLSPLDNYKACQPLSFFLTKVSGIPRQFNSLGAMSLRDILSPSMGNLEASCQFNFMFEVRWMMKQYPEEFRQKPVLLVQADKGPALASLQCEASPFPNISFCQARLDIPYGTHHTKMMFLLYDSGMRVVIHTANMIENDWHQKTQGAWVSPLFPKLGEGQAAAGGQPAGDSPTHFKRDLLRYVAAYRSPKLTEWEKHISNHDMSTSRVRIIASVPGRHGGSDMYTWGHMKLRKVLQEQGPDRGEMGQWPMVGQFSSIGSLGPDPQAWLCGEWLQSLKSGRGMASALPSPSKLQLIYPSRHNVRLCLEGYCGGGCLPYNINTAKKQPYLNSFLHQWKSGGRGRDRAIPHIKSYLRCDPNYNKAAWFLVTSANLSKAAWGCLEKKGTQLMIRSYELGVLFLPSDFGCGKSFPVTSRVEEAQQSSSPVLPLPYDLPPTPYSKEDRPWIMDIPYVDLPDTNGNKWCPPI